MNALKVIRSAFLSGVLIVLLVPWARADETGKIAGMVTEASTGEPLPGVNVVVTARWEDGEEVPLSNVRGTATDAEGAYFILRLHPGRYTVRASMVGYRTQVRTQVRVKIDKTTRLNFELDEQVVEGEGVTVTAYQEDRIEIDQTATKQAYTIAEMQNIAGITSIDDILDLQADVVDGHFRGGRSGEAQYLLGGASIVNPLDNNSSYQPMTPGLQEVEVYTSGFSAEYGNAQSGVVNMVPREGGDRWTTRLEVSSTLPGYETWGGSFYDPENMPFFEELNDPEEWLRLFAEGDDNTSLNDFRHFIPETGATYEDSLRVATFARDRWLQMVQEVGREYADQLDIRFDFSVGGPVTPDLKLFVAGRQDVNQPFVPVPNPNRERQLMGNITTRLSDRHKLKFNLSYFDAFTNVMSAGDFLDWSFDQEMAVPKRTETVQQYGIHWDYTRKASAVELDLNVLHTDSRLQHEFLVPGRYQRSDSLSAYDRNFADWYISAPSGQRLGDFQAFNTPRSHNQAITYDLQATVINQITKNNLLKGGLQLKIYDMSVFEEETLITPTQAQQQEYTVHPYEGALFLQDKMEFQGMIANVGLRLDFYHFNYEYYSDIYAPLRNPNYDPDDPTSGPPRSRELAATTKAEPFARLQPRVGISFPASENSVIHLNYGLFTQRPPFPRILLTKVDGFDQIEELGNPRLRPEKTLAYDVGLVQALPFGLTLELSAYFKDVKDLIQRAIYNDDQFIPYWTYTNLDYADIKGFHVNLEKSAGNWSTMLRYNFQSATGKSSTPFNNPITYFQEPAEGQEAVDVPDPEDIRLNFNRKHRLIWNVRANTPESAGPNIGGIHPLGNMAASFTLKAMSGRPYTWDPEGKGLRFNETTPSETDLRMRLQRRIELGESTLSVYLDGFNLLNTKHISYRVYSNEERLDRLKNVGRSGIEWKESGEQTPLLTRQSVFALSNQPRSFRVGSILKF